MNNMNLYWVYKYALKYSFIIRTNDDGSKLLFCKTHDDFNYYSMTYVNGEWTWEWKRY